MRPPGRGFGIEPAGSWPVYSQIRPLAIAKRLRPAAEVLPVSPIGAEPHYARKTSDIFLISRHMALDSMVGSGYR
jgi:hypothetical protein